MIPTNHQTQLIKNLKPIEIEAHLKYRCPNCEILHWISLKEASTKGFIIVCECNCILKPRLVIDLHIKYQSKNIKSKSVIQEPIVEEIIEPQVIEKITVEIPSKPVPPKELFDSCIPVLQNYGFTSSEARELISDTYVDHPVCSLPNFIKYCLKNIPLENNNI